jgi:hypothetical protein
MVAVRADASSSDVAVLTGVQAQDMGTFDEVTFTFSTLVCIDECTGEPNNPVPVITQAAYVPRPVLSVPSGEVVPVTGGAVIQISMSNATINGVPGSTPTYTGPLDIQPDLPNVVDIVATRDSDGVLSWAIGLRDGRVTASAQALPAQFPPTQGGFLPVRVVVDIPHVVVAVETQPLFTG